VLTKLCLVDRWIACIGLGIDKFWLTGFIMLFATYSCAEPFLPIEPSRQKELITLVRQDCGSCHGLTLQGGLGPALLPDALRDKPADHLKFVILQGRPGTAMPPWQRFLSDAEAEWIVSNLQKGFPREF
jgi:cytochrome c55X